MSTGAQWGSAFAAATTDAMAVYDEVLVPRLFVPWAELLLDRLAVAPGEAVLDVATGPGTVARLAAARVGPAGRVTGADLSPAMLAVARAKPAPPDAAPVEYVECPADALAVPDAAYDAVACQQGFQFFPDRPAALREMARAARPGGRLGLAVWRAIEECPFFDALATAVGRVLGADAEAAYRGGPWGLPDGDAIAALVRAAGFVDVDVAAHRLPASFEAGPDQVLATLAATTVAPQVAALDRAGRAELRARAHEALGPLTVDGAVRSEAGANVVTATAP